MDGNQLWCQFIDTRPCCRMHRFGLWCYMRLLVFPWTARVTNIDVFVRLNEIPMRLRILHIEYIVCPATLNKRKLPHITWMNGRRRCQKRLGAFLGFPDLKITRWLKFHSRYWFIHAAKWTQFVYQINLKKGLFLYSAVSSSVGPLKALYTYPHIADLFIPIPTRLLLEAF